MAIHTCIYVFKTNSDINAKYENIKSRFSITVMTYMRQIQHQVGSESGFEDISTDLHNLYI